MKKNLFSIAALLFAAGISFGQSSETTSNAEPVSSTGEQVVVDGAMTGTLYSNGPYYNIEGTPNISELQTALGLSTYGFNINDGGLFRIADDWEVTQSVSVEKLYMYSYQTGSGSNSTITYVTMRIWDGVPDAGGSVIWGNEFDDVMSMTEFSGAYRVLDTDHSNVDRPIMIQTIETPGLTLDPGTYWIDFSVGGSTGSGPWAPPVVITGDFAVGNALQFDGTTWNDMIDTGGGVQQALPFDVDGTTMGVQDLTSVEFSIYPNPTSKFLNVNSKNSIEKITVYSLTGQEVMKLAPKGKNAALDVSSLAKGTYVIQTVINGKTQTTKFVKR
ncbi:MAG: T9SS type A sorting domain-containing protein [Moheibacter sp.]